MKNKFVYLDGQYIQVDAKRLEHLTPGLLKSPGCFETMLVINGRIPALTQHVNRLKAGLKFQKIKLVITTEKIHEVVNHLLLVNKINCARLRLTVWKERKVLWAVVLEPWIKLTKKEYQQGRKIMLIDKKHQMTKLSQFKSLDYFVYREAYQIAKRKRMDDALLLNHKGMLTECSRANIFFFKKGVLMTPSLKSGCLNGVTRRIVLEQAKVLGIVLKEGEFDLAALLNSDEAFMTNSILGVIAIKSIGVKKIALGKEGEHTKLFREWYQKNLFSMAEK